MTANQAASGWDENALLRFAASLERGSEHPLAEAILDAKVEGIHVAMMNGDNRTTAASSVPAASFVRSCATSAGTQRSSLPTMPPESCIAAGVLYPTFGLMLSHAIAATEMALSLSLVSVIVNALRLRIVRL